MKRRKIRMSLREFSAEVEVLLRDVEKRERTTTRGPGEATRAGKDMSELQKHPS